MARRKTSRELDEDADFTAAVIGLYKAALGGRLQTFVGNQDRDVRKVAFGLTILRQLVDREMRAGNPDPGLPLLEAQQIIDALTTGRNHPVWQHVRGLKTERFRPQRAAPNSLESLGRIAVVALVRAYAQTASVSARAARGAVIEACRFADFEFGAEQIKGWDRTFRKEQDQGPDAFANQFIEDASKLYRAIEENDERAKNLEWFARLDASDRLLAIGRKRVWQLWAVPGTSGDL